MKVLFTKLDKLAKIPFRKSEEAVGFDVCTLYDAEIKSGQRAIIPTGLAVKIPKGHYIRVAPRSGLAAKKGIAVLAGVIDPDYTGEIKVILQNQNLPHFTKLVEVKDGNEETVQTGADLNTVRFSAGDAIAQFIFEKVEDDIQFKEVSELPKTARGDGGFGSTDK